MAQFIGKTISLISNSDIRYVGILHEINSENSTVSLKQVRSFGTEGRRGGRDEIPPPEGVYEFIVFRGSDVKDLKIADPTPAPPPPPPQSFPDPAIIQSQQQSSSYGGYQNPYYPPSQPQAPPYGQAAQGPAAPTGSYPAPPGNFVPYPSYPSDATNPPNADGEASIPKQQENVESKQKQTRIETPEEKTQETVTASVRHQPQSSSQSTVPSGKENARVNANSNGRAPHVRQRRTQPEGVEGDFDFDQSNAKFSKEALAEEVAEGSVAQVAVDPSESQEEFYNKKSSFFDNISSTSKDRFESTDTSVTGYQRRGEERKLNMETFGQATVHRGRGRGRGRGYRGRGRGDYRNNYNRSGNFNNFSQPQDQQQS